MKNKVIQLDGKDPEYPLVLHVVVGQADYEATFKLRTRDDGASRIIDGIIEKVYYYHRDFEDDEDVPDNTTLAERKTIDALVEYLKKQFPNTNISGTIKAMSRLAYNPCPREYTLGD